MTSAPPPPPPAPPLEPPAWQPPPPPPGPPARPQLRRSRTDKVLGGVSGGLAEYSGIDALLWRVGFVALALAGGTGLLVYLLLWLLMPATPVGAGPDERPVRVRTPAGPRSPLPGVTLAALLIVLGTLALVSRFTGWEPDATPFLGAALIVVGAALVVAAFSTGRTARGGLIAVGAVLSLALIAAESVPWDRASGGVGDRRYAPAVAEDVRRVYDGGLGNMTVDLSEVDVSDLDEPIRTRVDQGLGDLEVVLPRDADVRVTIDSGLGETRIFGTRGLTEGTFEGTGPGSWVDDGEPEIVLDVDGGMGNVEVTRG